MSKLEKIVAGVVLSYLGIGIVVASIVSFGASGWFDVDFNYFLTGVRIWPVLIWSFIAAFL
ncbi:MAG: hypothetical protein Q8R12_03815 [bacterium]|nr:hypothetical protein [bacterium]